MVGIRLMILRFMVGLWIIDPISCYGFNPELFDVIVYRFFAIHFLSGADNRTRNGWLGSANASSVLCRPPVEEIFIPDSYENPK